MSFQVYVRTVTSNCEYIAIAQDACAVFGAVYDFFGVCGVTVKPWRGEK
ncbi:hypothetical protein [Undibacterium umbellatum]|uniref:Uncharacterized protein n=1 Tax=Undibacterium umbellatum TaxID=2762300 RepID=A0ABR6ZH84_9BURK|nr:hypothetical protein [Undibacterium umbellatum]MBC3910705.1 hypothetical protein [Undibacterium umbellatum]